MNIFSVQTKYTKVLHSNSKKYHNIVLVVNKTIIEFFVIVFLTNKLITDPNKGQSP